MVISDGIPVVPRNRKSRNSVPNPSAEEKATRNSVPGNKNISKLPKFCSETLLRKRTQLGIPFHETKIDANSRNSVPNHSAEENTTRNSFPCNKNWRIHSECRSEPFHGRETNSEQNATAVYIYWEPGGLQFYHHFFLQVQTYSIANKMIGFPSVGAMALVVAAFYGHDPCRHGLAGLHRRLFLSPPLQ